MKTEIEEVIKPKNLRNSVMSIPNSIYSGKILDKDIEIDKCYRSEVINKNSLLEIWNKQHPIIHTWLVLSSISICFLSALFYIIP